MAGIAGALQLCGSFQVRLREKMAITRIFANGWASPLLRYILGGTAAALLVSLAATLATFPLVAFHFNRVPLFGIFVTLLALPSLPVLLVSSLVSAGAGLIHPLLGQVFGWVAWLPLSYLLLLVSHGPDTTISGAWIGKPFIWSWHLVLGGPALFAGADRAFEKAGGSSHFVAVLGKGWGYRKLESPYLESPYLEFQG